jgi:predicted Na+-dependent transporter
MGRWPNETRSTLVTAALMFVLFPLLAWLAWWFVKR